MKHLGDITKINGAEIPPVDVITGGSPCQDLSVAGLRKGLAGERSGLFMDQIRVIKEMRAHDRESGRADDLVRPRYMVWENVPGAFSSNQGKDFAAVLEETIRVIEPEAPDVPVPPKGWPGAGCLYDEMGRWSVAWRVHDAQFWGVPQRRKRIALIADFGGLSAPEILFERQGLQWHPEPGCEERESTPAGTEGGFGESGQGYWQRGIRTIRAEGENRPSRPSNVIVSSVMAVHQNASGEIQTSGIGYALSTNGNASGRNSPLALAVDAYNHTVTGDVAATLNATSAATATRSGPMVMAVDVYNQTISGDTAPSLTAAAGGTNTSGPKVLTNE